MAVVRQALVTEAAPGHPRTASFVAEVARRSLRIDRAMAAVYAEAGIDEYWVIDVVGGQVEVFRDPHDGRYRHAEVVGAGAALRPSSLPGPDIEIATLFVSRPG